MLPTSFSSGNNFNPSATAIAASFAEATATAVICTEVSDRAPVGAADKYAVPVGAI